MEKACEPQTHILAIPFPAQGHISPMLQLSKRLASKGLKVTLLALVDNKLAKGDTSTVCVETVSIKTEEEKPFSAFDDWFENFQTKVSGKVRQVIEEKANSGCPVSCLVYDSIMSWIMDIAAEVGVAGASLFTQPCFVSTVFCQVLEGSLTIPIEQKSVSAAGMPLTMEINDLPSFVYDLEKYPGCIKLMLGQISNIEKADWIFVNTVYSLEEKVVNWMARKWPIKPIGPLIPSMFLDKRLNGDKEYGLSLFKPNSYTCMKWLDSKEPGSAVYVSFGSVFGPEEDQMAELAWALKTSNRNFLWVVRESEEKKLPRNFVEETSEMGLVVSWCNQLEVLAHKSVGCFMTHCGWNSTLEALSLGVPMVAMPCWADQPTNAKFVADVWEVGVKVKINEKGFVTRDEIERCISEVMEGERGNEMRRNSKKWKELALQAANEGGNSHNNIEEFVAKLVSNSHKK